MTRKHQLPLGTHIKLEGEPYLWEVCDYQELHHCEPGCDLDHDHYEEPYIVVRPSTRTAFPISKIETVFLASERYGREPKPSDFDRAKPKHITDYLGQLQ